MTQKIPFGKYTSIKQLVYSKLLSSLSIYASTHKIVCTIHENIPLYQGRDNRRVLYITGLALQLSKSHNCIAMEVASEIAADLSTRGECDFSVSLVPPGWIHLEITHQCLANWLQRLVELGREQEVGVQGVGSMGESLSPGLFPAQYVHARCCSLIRLGKQEGLTSELDEKSIPWLGRDSQLRLHHPAALKLIVELVQVMDKLEFTGNNNYPTAANWEKTTLSLSQTWEHFWRNCRIWGGVKSDSPELAQARLGLIMATQSVLRLLLQEKLGISPLHEL